MSDHADKKPGLLARLLRLGSTQDDTAEPPLTLEDLQKQVKRMAKEVYKANALAESAIEANRETLAALHEELEAAQAEDVAVARLELATTLLPVADGIAVGLQAGASQVEAVSVESAEAARILEGWLSGQRLLRERVLRLLEAEGIHLMQPIGEMFDPHRHVAVKTVSRPDRPNHMVIAIERDGYLHGSDVLRFAEVVVNRITDLSDPMPNIK